MKIKIGNHIPWKEVLDLHEVDAQCDEYGWDDLLESMEDGGGSPVTNVRRVSTPTPNFYRHDAVKIASSSSWDTDFAAAQSHARAVMGKFGNAR